MATDHVKELLKRVPGKVPELHHYLLTMPVKGGCVHAYMMAEDGTDHVVRIFGMMCDAAEDQRLKPLGSLQPALFTLLDDVNARRVVDYVRAHHRESREKLDQATDFHTTIWVIPHSDPDALWLARLH